MAWGGGEGVRNKSVGSVRRHKGRDRVKRSAVAKVYLRRNQGTRLGLTLPPPLPISSVG